MDWAKTRIEPIPTACPRFSQGSRKPRGAGARGHMAADGVGPAHEALTAEPIGDVPVEAVCWDVLTLPPVNQPWERRLELPDLENRLNS
jgi:hypothetical protein